MAGQTHPNPYRFSGASCGNRRTIEPAKEVSFVAFPGTTLAGPHHYALFMRGTTPLTARLIKPILIDAEHGQLTAIRDMPWYVTALLISQPLHFGDYGGLPLKIVWALLDFLTIILLASGLYLWWKKRHASIEQLLTDAGPHDPILPPSREVMGR